jgi:hypothetical protein
MTKPNVAISVAWQAANGKAAACENQSLSIGSIKRNGAERNKRYLSAWRKKLSCQTVSIWRKQQHSVMASEEKRRISVKAAWRQWRRRQRINSENQSSAAYQPWSVSWRAYGANGVAKITAAA